LSNWIYFSYETDPMLACSHCGVKGMNEKFMELLVSIRTAVGLPFRINSGYRCAIHNAAVSSTGANGPHTTGRAVDIAADSRLKFLIQREAMKRGVTRFGIARTFIHIDDLSDDDGFPSKVIWSYS
jgi:uncharacterized protein YcbK (DUF882 family)